MTRSRGLLVGLTALTAAACSAVEHQFEGTGSMGGGGGAGGSPSTSSGGGGSGGASVCGNGVLEDGEACDDGNEADGDACSKDCKVTEFTVQVDPDRDYGIPKVATNTGQGNGKGFFVAWMSTRPNSGDIESRAYEANGARVHEKPNNQGAAEGLLSFDLATNPDNRKIILAVTEQEAFYNVLEPDGESVLFPYIFLDVYADAYAVTASDSGEFAVVAADCSEGWGNVSVQCIDPEGSLVGVAKKVGEVATGAGPGRCVGIWGVGEGFVATFPFEESHGAALKQHVGVELDKHCAKKGSSFPLAAGLVADAVGVYVPPANGAAGAGFTTSFAAGPRVKHRIFTSAGVPTSNEILVSTKVHAEKRPSIARGESGRYVVAWGDRTALSPSDQCRVMARLFEADGTPVGPPTQVNQDSKGCHADPGVAVNADGDAMFVWSVDDGSGALKRLDGVVVPRLLAKAP